MKQKYTVRCHFIYTGTPWTSSVFFFYFETQRFLFILSFPELTLKWLFCKSILVRLLSTFFERPALTDIRKLLLPPEPDKRNTLYGTTQQLNNTCMHYYISWGPNSGAIELTAKVNKRWKKEYTPDVRENLPAAIDVIMTQW